MLATLRKLFSSFYDPMGKKTTTTQLHLDLEYIYFRNSFHKNTKN